MWFKLERIWASFTQTVTELKNSHVMKIRYKEDRNIFYLTECRLGLQLMIIFISCLVYQISENAEKCLSLFAKAQNATSNILFCQQPKDI